MHNSVKIYHDYHHNRHVHLIYDHTIDHIICVFFKYNICEILAKNKVPCKNYEFIHKLGIALANIQC